MSNITKLNENTDLPFALANLLRPRSVALGEAELDVDVELVVNVEAPDEAVDVACVLEVLGLVPGTLI